MAQGGIITQLLTKPVYSDHDGLTVGFYVLSPDSLSDIFEGEDSVRRSSQKVKQVIFLVGERNFLIFIECFPDIKLQPQGRIFQYGCGYYRGLLIAPYQYLDSG